MWTPFEEDEQASFDEAFSSPNVGEWILQLEMKPI